MPNWKKLITSGSSGSLAYLNVDTSIDASSFTGSLNIPDSSTLGIGSQTFYPQGNNGFSVNEDFDPSNSSTQTAYHYTSGTGRETVAFTLARTGQFTDGFGIYGTSADNTFVTFGEQNNTSFEWRRGVGIRPLDLDGGTLLAKLSSSGDFDISGGVTGSSFTGSFVGDGSGLTGVTTTITEESTVTDTFTNATTASISHLFGTKNVIVTVYDSNDDVFIPSRINTPDTNTAVIYMDPATTGRVVVAKGGHLVSGSIHKTLITGTTSSIITHNLQEEFPIVQLYESASKEMFIPQTVKSIDEDNTQIILSELIDCYVVIKR